MAAIRRLGLRVDCVPCSGLELLGAQSNVSELWPRAHRLSVAVRPNNGLDCYNAIAYPPLIIATEHGPFRLFQSAHCAHNGSPSVITVCFQQFLLHFVLLATLILLNNRKTTSLWIIFIECLTEEFEAVIEWLPGSIDGQIPNGPLLLCNMHSIGHISL